MNLRRFRFSRAILLSLALLPAAARADDWYSWRGPSQDGRSAEKYTENVLSETPDWTYDISTRGAPVVANGRLFLFSYSGTGALQAEALSCFDVKTGKLLWAKRLADFLTDNSYSRYAIGSAAIDKETGNVYLVSTAGEFVGMDRDGKTLWQHSLMEEIGRLSFPNGRTGSPVILGDLVIVRGITANWGGDGPARDRFYAYHKVTGDLVWVSTPGTQPQDSSFSSGIFALKDGAPIMYATTGCGHYIALNPLNGKPIWRYKVAKGGINASCILVDGKLMAAHDKENVDTTEIGGMECIRLPEGPLPPGTAEDPVPVLPASAEVWRQPYSAESSSPVFADGLIYQVEATGVLAAVDPVTGAELWNMKLGPGNLHASPAWVNGVLYVPIISDVASDDGLLYAIKPSREKGEILKRVKLQGFALGAPAISNGKLYIGTTKHLYAFTIGKGEITGTGDWFTVPKTTDTKVVALQPLPQEVRLHPGQNQKFTIRGLNAKGFPVSEVKDATWESFVPPTAKVKAHLDASFMDGALTAAGTAKESAGAFKATSGAAFGVIRGRVLPDLPIKQDFESFDIAETAPENGDKFAYPPLPWIGARFKWEVREIDGNKALFKTLSNIFFQRAFSFIGTPEMKNYTMQADVRTEGNRRMKSEVGLINQRYLIALKGNGNEIEVSSNQERLKVTAPFPIAAKTWYTQKTRVDVAADGSGVIRGKVWPKGEPEPEKWTIEVPHAVAHDHGSPGLYGFALQGMHPVYIDNISVTPNTP
jgi:outer membrane protein assembly factor BamB